jgi:ribosome-associated toxin RatA of RatAB toxin-antitoxin module
MIHESRESSGSPERLWSLVRDIERWPHRVPTVTSIRHVGGPSVPAVGSRYDVEQPGLPRNRFEITAWDETDRSFTWVSSAPGVRVTADHRVAATPQGSRLDLSVDFAGAVGRLMGRMMRERSARMVAAEAETFTRLAAEDGSDAPLDTP